MNTCPKCGTHKLEEVVEEVDIGVGTQRHLIGFECLECGAAIACCSQCGVPDGESHASWCPNAFKTASD